MNHVVCILALLLGDSGGAAPAPPQGDGERVDSLAVNQAIDRGVDWLLRVQRLDGSWVCHAPWDYPAGQTALTLYTLLKCGVPQWHPAVRRALAYLRAVPARKTYSVACLLMALGELDGDHDAWIRENVDFLLDALRPGSYSSYPQGGGDLSNTQYLALGLKVGVEHGVKIPAKHFERLATVLLRSAQYGGGWGYRMNSKPTGSMTVAGGATLLICLKGLAAQGKDGPWRGKVRSAISQTEDWLAKHFSPSSNPRPFEAKPGIDRWKYYYLYGVERFAAFAGLKKFGKYDWYQLGARFLLGKQHKSGKWPAPWGWEEEFDTCFALLFLRRATAIPTGEAVQSKRFINTFGRDDPKSEVSIRGDVDPKGFLQMWLSSFGERPRLLYEWDADQGRGLRVVEVRYFVNGEQVARLEGSGVVPAGANRFPTRMKITENGTYIVQALVKIRAAGADPEDTLELRSPEEEAKVDLLFGGREQRLAEEVGANLIRPEEVEAIDCSSEHDGGWWAAKRALDGSMGTGWLCKDEDETPSIKIRFARPLRARTLKLTHVQPRADHKLTSYGTAEQILVRINGRKKIHATLGPERRRKQVVNLGSSQRIRQLEIFAITRRLGDKKRRAIGFQEIELFK